MKNAFLIFFIAHFTICSSFHAVSQDVVKIKRLVTPIEFDGRPFEETWSSLDFFPLIQFKPYAGAEPSERSEVMITYDDEYVWVGARLYMQDPSKIAITSKKRDDPLSSSDAFDIELDTYNDNENVLVFKTTPTASRSDIHIANDAVVSADPLNTFNISWNTFWDVKTSVDEEGWYVEMRIPFSSLQFRPENNIATMGLIINRTISSKNEVVTFPEIDPKYGEDALAKASLAATIEFEGAQPSKPVYVSPFVIGGLTRNWVLNTERTEYISDDTPDFDAGLDIKYNVSTNLTLDLTANTDFAQVEADNQQVNLTRYSLYFPEKRMFFQERSNLFNFNLGGRSNLFYSRNIGLSGGKPVRIYGGARLVGRMGKWDIGLLDMQTEKQSNILPGENFGVFRARRQVFNPYSYVGGMFTSRIGMNGDVNFAYGLDGIFRVFGNDYFDVKMAQTYDSRVGNKINSIDPMFLSAKWERRSVKGFAYSLGYSYTGQEFNPGIGFVNMGSLQGLSGNILYGWLPGPESTFRQIAINLSSSRHTRLEDGKLESLVIAPGLSLETKKGYQGNISIEYQQEGVLYDFPITDSISISEGEYTFTNGRVVFQTPESKPFGLTLNINMGEFYDGQRYGLSFSSGYDVSPSLQLSASYQFDRIAFPDRDSRMNIHIAYAKVLYMLNTKLSASIFVQYVSTTDDLISNFRLRFNPREGNDFYFVFNNYRSVSNAEFIPTLPKYFNRTFLLKYTHTFRL